MKSSLWQWSYLAALALPLIYVNCSQPSGSSSDPGSPASAITGEAHGTTAPTSLIAYTVLPNGTIQVYQDKRLDYSPTAGALGSYSIDSLPSWASFDATTGTIQGVPLKLSDTGTFSITDTVNSRTYGPYKIQVVGDVLKEQQWHLLNTGQTGYALTPGISGADIHMSDSVKNNILGIGVRVAISDSGVVISHPDLKFNVLAGESRNYLNNYASTRSWLGDPTPSSLDPSNAHGTNVAGLLAAQGWNGIGGRGVAPEAKFAAFLFIQAQDQLAQNGYYDAAFLDQFTGPYDVFNYSWGDPQCMLTEYPQSYNDKLVAATTQQRSGLGSLHMIAAGNNYTEDVNDCYSNVAAGSDFVLGNSNFSEQDTTPYAIVVAAVNANGVSSSYSSPGSSLWISATGGEYGQSVADPSAASAAEPALVTTDYPGCQNGLKSESTTVSSFDAGASPNSDCNYDNTMNGTSGATPVASGVVALLLQANPKLSWRDVKYILAKTADLVNPTVNPARHPVSSSNLTGHVYEQGWITNAAGFHFQNSFGFGRVNADAAVQMAQSYTFPLGTLKTTNWKHDSGALQVAIPDANAVGISQSLAVADVMSLEAVQIRVSASQCASDLGLELTSPSGTKSILMNINNRLRDGAIVNHTFLSNAFLGEPSAGTWTLKVLDGKAGCTAQLTNWKLNFLGH